MNSSTQKIKEMNFMIRSALKGVFIKE